MLEILWDYTKFFGIIFFIIFYFVPIVRFILFRFYLIFNLICLPKNCIYKLKNMIWLIFPHFWSKKPEIAIYINKSVFFIKLCGLRKTRVEASVGIDGNINIALYSKSFMKSVKFFTKTIKYPKKLMEYPVFARKRCSHNELFNHFNSILLFNPNLKKITLHNEMDVDFIAVSRNGLLISNRNIFNVFSKSSQENIVSKNDKKTIKKELKYLLSMKSEKQNENIF